MADPLTGEIIGAAIEVHRELGPGLLESIYEAAFCRELEIRNLRYRRQVPVTISYKGEVLSYLRASKLKKGLILNFGAPRLIDGIKRVSL